MLKISIVDTFAQRRIVLEGKLIPPWVTELKKTWKALAADLARREFVVDVGDVTFISREGENALLELMRHGAKFQCRGVFTRHIVEQLARRHKSLGTNCCPCDSAESKGAKGQE
jgi:Ferredoxin thioredoxin reductase catalytic beta chain